MIFSSRELWKFPKQYSFRFWSESFQTRCLTNGSKNNERGKALPFTQANFDNLNEVEEQRMKDAMKKRSENPFGPFVFFSKAVLAGFVAATVSSIVYGGYNPVYRRELDTKFPLAAAVLNLVLGKQEELEEPASAVESWYIPAGRAGTFKEEIKTNLKSNDN